MDDFDPITGLKLSHGMFGPGDHVPIDLDRQASPGDTERLDQLADGTSVGGLLALPVDENFHSGGLSVSNG